MVPCQWEQTDKSITAVWVHDNHSAHNWYQFLCLCVNYSVAFLPHSTTPGNRQYTSRESVANGKQGGSPFIQQKENSRLLAHRLSPTEVVDQRSHWWSIQSNTLGTPDSPIVRWDQRGELDWTKPRRLKNLGAFFVPDQKFFLTKFFRTIIIMASGGYLWVRKL